VRKTALIIIYSFFILSCVDKDKNAENKIALSKNSDTTAVFKWTTELCENTGTYNPKKYSELELKNTYDLWFTFSGIALETNSNAHFIEDIEKLNIYKLMSEYIDKKALYNRKIVSNPFWNKLKKERLQELEDEYELKKITIEAYSNPSILLNNKYSKYCSEYAKVLSSNDTIELLKSWRNLIEKQKSKNGAPEKFMERYNEKYNSKDRLVYAKIELMTYGWWNCGNSKLKRVNDDGSMEKEFNKLFIQIKTVCDEP
jgi:hypothetical protein